MARPGRQPEREHIMCERTPARRQLAPPRPGRKGGSDMPSNSASWEPPPTLTHLALVNAVTVLTHGCGMRHTKPS